MITVLYHRDGKTEEATTVAPEWLAPDATSVLWVDLCDPTLEEARILSDMFHFHELAVEDAMTSLHHPKIEAYDGYLYLILHGIDFHAAHHRFATHDTDFFIGPRYLVTLHDGKTRSVAHVRSLCTKLDHLMEEGPLALAHRILDTMVDHYVPEVDKLSDQLDRFEEEVFEGPTPDLMRSILALKRDVASMRRVVLPQRDVIARLARREFSLVTDQLAYRFRDVYDDLVRLSDESMAFQDRISGLLDAHLAGVSNKLNQVMKVLTMIATVFMPLTVLTGIYGMNVHLPQLPGGDGAQFYWIMGMLAVTTVSMVIYFRTRDWM